MTSRPALILASASPRRLDLLRQIAIIPDEVISSDIDETPAPDESPTRYAARVAAAKAVAVARAGAVSLAADTVVSMGRRILPKADAEDDVRMCLRALAGRSHVVLTAVALVRPDAKVSARLVQTRVTFKQLSAQEIDLYAASGEGIGKAGGYAIQGAAARFVRRLNGSYSAVVGLPLCETANLLESVGIPPR